MSEWVKVKDRLPAPYAKVLLFEVGNIYSCGHLTTNGKGEIITRPLTAPGEVARQWPAWEVGDPEMYHEATHWMPLPERPK